MKRIFVGILIVILIVATSILYYVSIQNIRHTDEYIDAKKLALSDGNYHVLAENLFTNGPQQYVFLLENDTNQRFWYFIYKGEIVKKVNHTDGISIEKLQDQLLTDDTVAYTDIYYTIPGARIDLAAAEVQEPYYYQLTDSDLIWEVVGRNTRDRMQYAYLDFYTQKPIWIYELK